MIIKELKQKQCKNCRYYSISQMNCALIKPKCKFHSNFRLKVDVKSIW